MSIEVRIQIVLLISKYQSETQVIQQMKKQVLVNLPSTHTIKVIYSKFVKCGSVHDIHRLSRLLCSDNVIKEIDDCISKHTDTSTIKMSKIMNISHMTVPNVLKKNYI